MTTPKEARSARRVSPFTNPRPSLELQEVAAKLAELMRAEGWWLATVDALHAPSLQVSSLKNEVAGTLWRTGAGDEMAEVVVDADVPGLALMTIDGPAYECDRGARCPVGDNDHDESCATWLFT